MSPVGKNINAASNEKPSRYLRSRCFTSLSPGCASKVDASAVLIITRGSPVTGLNATLLSARDTGVVTLDGVDALDGVIRGDGEPLGVDVAGGLLVLPLESQCRRSSSTKACESRNVEMHLI